MADIRKWFSAPTMKLLFTVLRLVVIAYAVDIPTDWKRFIDPEILQRDLGSDYRAIYGNERFEGDIAGVFNDASVSQTGQMERNVINGEGSRWPGGLIPYTFPSGSQFTPAERTFIRQAMRLISIMTFDCVRFVWRSTETDHISFVRGIGCSSNVGRQGGEQHIFLMPACMRDYGDVQHEIMHALGFYHEVSRSDRDEHVLINFNNIAKSARSQFDKHLDSDDLHIPYDYESVMHYPFNAFAVDNSEPTIVPQLPRAKIGQNKNLSPLDVLRLQRAYHCETISDPRKLLSASDETKGTAEERPVLENAACASQPRKPFPNFAFRKVTADQCRSLDSPGCNVSGNSSGCSGDVIIDVNCAGTSSELLAVSSRIAKLNSDRPIRFMNYDNQSTPEVFAPVRAQVIGLTLDRCESVHVTQKLPKLDLPNLISLGIYRCDMVIIRSQDFASSCLLRMITFWQVTFDSIEVGTFANLPDLQHITFERQWSRPFSKETSVSIMKLHCDCQYSWLRKWLNRKPRLIAPKAPSEIFKVGDLHNSLLNRAEISVPVDCAQKDLNSASLDMLQEPFSINDPCL